MSVSNLVTSVGDVHMATWECSNFANWTYLTPTCHICLRPPESKCQSFKCAEIGKPRTDARVTDSGDFPVTNLTCDDMYPICTRCVPDMYPICTRYVPDMYPICTQILRVTCVPDNLLTDTTQSRLGPVEPKLEHFHVAACSDV